MTTWKDYRRFLTKPPRLVVEWFDDETGARGWLVINSLRGGASGGGTRMRKGVTREEVTYLSKSMEMKFAFSGPPIGGAKSGIDFDPRDPRKRDVLRRWFQTVRPYLSTCYGTGGDVNIDHTREVVPLCDEMGLRHPQQGVMVGHLGASDVELDLAIKSLHDGIHEPVADTQILEGCTCMSVSDVITGFGVVESAAALHRARGGSLEGQRVIIEGFGNVGGSAALYFARSGARIVALIDGKRAAIRPAGFKVEEIEDLLSRRAGGLIPDTPWATESEERESGYRVEADIFVPAAISGSVDHQRLLDLKSAGVRSIVCGANQPFREARLGETATFEAADHAFDVIPDCVASLGMARAFCHFMSAKAGEASQPVFDVVRRTMADSVSEIVSRRGSEHGRLVESTIGMALERIASENEAEGEPEVVALGS
jgi:glutamate dehydrogenase/leucine dehydrogenase